MQTVGIGSATLSGMTNETQFKFSDVPVHVRMREYFELRDEGRIVTVEGKSYMPVDRQMRPVHIAWHRH